MFYDSSDDEGYDSMDDNIDPFTELFHLRRLIQGGGHTMYSDDSDMEDEEAYSSDEEQQLQKIQVQFPDNIYQKIFMFVPSSNFKHAIFANKKFKSLFDNEEFYKERFINEFCKYRKELIHYSAFGPQYKVIVNDQAVITAKLEVEAPYPDTFSWKKKWITRMLFDYINGYSVGRKCGVCHKRIVTYYSALKQINDLRVTICLDCEKDNVITFQNAAKKV